MPLLVDMKIYGYIMRFLYGRDYHTCKVRFWLKDVPLLYGAWSHFFWKTVSEKTAEITCNFFLKNVNQKKRNKTCFQRQLSHICRRDKLKPCRQKIG